MKAEQRLLVITVVTAFLSAVIGGVITAKMFLGSASQNPGAPGTNYAAPGAVNPPPQAVPMAPPVAGAPQAMPLTPKPGEAQVCKGTAKVKDKEESFSETVKSVDECIKVVREAGRKICEKQKETGKPTLVDAKYQMGGMPAMTLPLTCSVL